MKRLPKRYVVVLAVLAVSAQCRADEVLTKPALLWDSCALPHVRYPLESRRNKETGTAEVRVYIESDGKPSKAEIAKSSGHDLLDRAARDWLLACRFRPQSVNGQATAAWVVAPIDFSAPQPPPPTPASGAFCESHAPEYPKESRRRGETGTTIIKIHVLEDGWPDQILIEKSSGHSRLDDSVKEWIMSCRLKPPAQNGTPASAWVTQAYTFKLRN
jgi:protein TonB